MRFILVNFLALAVALGAAQGAFADEQADNSPAVDAVADHDWTGFYAGGHAGYRWVDNSWKFPFFEYYNVAPGDDFSTDLKGFMGGVQGGYNRQVGRWVFGVEASYDPTNTKEKDTGPVTSFFPNDSFKTRIDDVVTVTGRVGYTNNAWLFYAKGGWANAKLSLHALSGVPGPGVTASVSDRIDGGTLGVGAEYMVTPKLIAGLGYDWIGLKGNSFSTTTGGTQPGIPFHIDSRDFNLQMLTARISYKF